MNIGDALGDSNRCAVASRVEFKTAGGHNEALHAAVVGAAGQIGQFAAQHRAISHSAPSQGRGI